MWKGIVVETLGFPFWGVLFWAVARRGAACWIGVSATRADRENLENADASSLYCIGQTPNIKSVLYLDL